MTIVGFERKIDNEPRLLVFDPMFRGAYYTARLADSQCNNSRAKKALKPYRRGQKYLRKYNEFEILLSGYDSIFPSCGSVLTSFRDSLSSDAPGSE